MQEQLGTSGHLECGITSSGATGISQDLPNVIINADDLGVSQNVNAAIGELMAANRITSASVMANGAAFGDAVNVAMRFPDCSFGVHLNATEFAPLTGLSGWRGIVSEGSFNGIIRRRPVRGIVSRLTEEWGAQVQRVVDSGIPVSHLDSHHHTHTLPWTLSALKRTQARFGIERVRNTRNLFPEPPSLKRLGLKIAKSSWLGLLLHYRPITRTTDFFGSVEAYVTLAHRSALPCLDGKRVELMCHPGHPGYAVETSILLRGLAEEAGRKFVPITYWNI